MTIVDTHTSVRGAEKESKEMGRRRDSGEGVAGKSRKCGEKREGRAEGKNSEANEERETDPERGNMEKWWGERKRELRTKMPLDFLGWGWDYTRTWKGQVAEVSEGKG